jgi:hypothetical protein
MSGWIAEVDEQAIAQVLGNMPLVPLDHACAGLLISLHNRLVVFRVELGRERGGADEVTEHHGQLTTLTFGSWNVMRDAWNVWGLSSSEFGVRSLRSGRLRGTGN